MGKINSVSARINTLVQEDCRVAKYSNTRKNIKPQNCSEALKKHTHTQTHTQRK